MLIKLVLIFGVLLLFAPSTWAMPAQIVILRNAEKIRTGYELNERGWERAYGLVSFIKYNRNTSRYGKPVAIFAVKPQKNASQIRMRQTVIPLSLDLKIPIQANFDQSDLAKLYETIATKKQYNGKTVVICWPSEQIPNLIHTFGMRRISTNFQDTYDRAWIMRYQDNRLVEFKDVPQRLLAGDSKS